MEIRLCERNDVERVMKFLAQHWSQNHVLSRSRTLFDWQHGNASDQPYDFAAAFEGDEVFGCLGFIRNSRFDPALADADTLWLTTWKAREDGPKGLGLRLHAFVQRNVPHRWIGTVGNNAKVAAIYKALGYQIGTLKQFVVLHPELLDFRLAKIDDDQPRRLEVAEADGELTLEDLPASALPELEAISSEWLSEPAPTKSLGYFKQRFLDHPFYDYSLLLVRQEGKPCGILATRMCKADSAKCLRIVDARLQPKLQGDLATPLQMLLTQLDCEYADWYRSDAENFGLLQVDVNSERLIAPNYFEPYLRKNVAINWAIKGGKGDTYSLCKADADQDRPSLLE